MSTDEVLRRQFGATLKTLREAAGISQEELGFRADLHRTEIGMLERGIRLPRIDTMTKLCGSLGCDPNEICAGMDWTPREARPGAFRVDGSEPTP